ncbi:MAG: SdpI family protein [Candidatus Kapaibacterium sp.]
MVNETHEEGQKITAQESFLKKEWALLVILILPFILIAIYWNRIPDRVPMHWNIRGEVDNWGGKNSVIITPLINMGVALLLYFIPRIDPKKMNYPLFERAFRMVRLTLAAFVFAIFLLTVAPAMGVEVDANTFIYTAIPLLFLIMGNFMRSFRQNFFAGIRTPWTLSSPEVWEKTHRLAAWLWTGGSVVFIVFRLIVGRWDYLPHVFLSYIGVLVIIPIVMSYVYYKQIKV